MSYDYYAEARKLAQLLKDEGLNERGEKVLSSLEEGFTATEILMVIRWNLNELLSTELGSAEARSCARRLAEKIDIIMK